MAAVVPVFQQMRSPDVAALRIKIPEDNPARFLTTIHSRTASSNGTPRHKHRTGATRRRRLVSGTRASRSRSPSSDDALWIAQPSALLTLQQA